MQKRCITLRLGIPLLALALAGCPDSPSDSPPVGTITIKNIPQYLGGNTTNPSYKIYVSVSNSQNYTDPHVSQGTRVLTEEDFSNGKATVTVDLYHPPAAQEGTPHPDPDAHTGGWAGDAANFSVTIAPQRVSTSADITVKAGITLNDTSRERDWDSSLLDLRGMDMISQINAIFSWIVCNDGPNVGSGISIIPKGDWTRIDDKIKFTIYDNLSFSCTLIDMGNVEVTGKLSKDVSAGDPPLAANEYLMADMVATNPLLPVASYNDTKVKLTFTFSTDGTDAGQKATDGGNQFTFDSPNEQVKGFFGGTFIRAE